MQPQLRVFTEDRGKTGTVLLPLKRLICAFLSHSTLLAMYFQNLGLCLLAPTACGQPGYCFFFPWPLEAGLQTKQGDKGFDQKAQPNGSGTVSQEWLQPKLDGKRRFMAESFLCFSYVHIKTGAWIFHRGFFEKSCSLVVENLPVQANWKMWSSLNG